MQSVFQLSFPRKLSSCIITFSFPSPRHTFFDLVVQVWLSSTEDSQRLYPNPHTYAQPSCPQQGEIQMNTSLFPEGWRKDNILLCREREENFKWVPCRMRGCILSLALLVLFEELTWSLVLHRRFPPAQVWKVESRKIWREWPAVLWDEPSNMSRIQKC